MNEQNNTLTDDQRKAFANLIREAQQRYERDFDQRAKSLKDSFAPRFEAGTKVRHIMDDIRTLRAKIGEAAEQLRRFGFRVMDDGFVSIDYDVSGQPYREYEKEKESLQNEHAENMEAFRQSVFDVWSAKTPDEAREIVRRLM